MTRQKSLTTKAMKLLIKICVILAICGSTSFAQNQTPQTIETVNHVKYEKAIVTSVAPDAITVTHATGVARIPFTDLPPAIQKQYGYEPAKAGPQPQLAETADNSEPKLAPSPAQESPADIQKRYGHDPAKAHHMLINEQTAAIRHIEQVGEGLGELGEEFAAGGSRGGQVAMAQGVLDAKKELLDAEEQREIKVAKQIGLSDPQIKSLGDSMQFERNSLAIEQEKLDVKAHIAPVIDAARRGRNEARAISPR
jgi:hypothetical protein